MTAVADITAARARRATTGPSIEQFAAQTAVLYLGRRKPGFKRAARAEEFLAASDEVDRKMVTVAKHLLDASILSEINSEDRRIVAYLESRSVFSNMLAARMWAIPLPLVDEVDEEIDGYKARRAALVTVLVRQKYAKAKADAKTRLGKHYDESQYPSEDALEASFAVATKWLSYNVPAALKAASEEVYERATAQAEREVQNAAEEAIGGVRMVFAGLVAALQERLGDDPETGKPNQFGASTVTKLQDFLATFGARNAVYGDVKLAKLVEQAQNVLTGVPVERLKKDVSVRKQAETALTKITEGLAKLDVVAPARKIRDAEEV